MPSSRRLPAWLQGALLALLVFAAFGSALPNRWIWDDDDYVTENPLLTEDGGLARIWTAPRELPQYYPLVHTTFWLERRLWGDAAGGDGPNPFGYHFDNLLLHALGAVLLWRLLLRLGLPGAWLLAALWAVHPVCVESVAWVTERKNLLSLALALASILQSLRWAEQRQRLALLWAILLFAGALLSKTVVASAPAVTLLLLWWRRRPLTARVVLPLAAMLLAGGLLGLYTAVTEVEHVGAEGQAWDWSLAERGLIAGRVLWSYCGRLLWPFDYCFIYPRWQIDADVLWQWLFPAAALALVAALVLLQRRGGRGPLAAVLIFGGVLFPALGFLNVYPHQFSFVADHFQHHAAPAIVVLAGRLLLFRRDGRARGLLTPLAGGAAVAMLAVLSFRSGRDFADEETLWKATLKRNPEASIAHNNLGRMAYERALATRTEGLRPGLGEPERQALHDETKRLMDEALQCFEDAVLTGPYDSQAFNNLAQVLFQERTATPATDRRIEELVARARELAPRYVSPLVTQADLYRRQNRLEEAIRAFEEANRLNTLNLSDRAGHEVEGRIPQVCVNMGVVLLFLRRPAEAIENLHYALRSGATAVPAAINLLWLRSTHPDPAVRSVEESLDLVRQILASGAASDPRVLDAVASAYANAGDFARAVRAGNDAVFSALQTGQTTFAGRIRSRLELYKTGQPLRTEIGLPQ